MGRNHVPQRASIQLCSRPYWPLSGKFLLGITKFDLHFHHPFPRNSNWWRYTSETCQILLLTHGPTSLYPNLYWCSVSVLRVATVHSGGSHSESGPTGILSRDGAQEGLTDSEPSLQETLANELFSHCWVLTRAMWMLFQNQGFSLFMSQLSTHC